MDRTPDDVLNLLGQHGGHFFALLLRITLHVETAEDLLQELFCKLAISEPFRRAGDPYAYAIRAATNLAFSNRRARARAPAVQLAGHDPAAPTNSALGELIARDDWHRVLDAITELNDPAREIIVLRYLEHESFDTIARRLGKTSHQARALCYKALARLRDKVGDKSLPSENAVEE